jgi:hypothetical protein
MSQGNTFAGLFFSGLARPASSSRVKRHAIPAMLPKSGEQHPNGTLALL